MLKHIGLLELHYHAKYLYTMARICKTKQTKVTIFTTEDIYSKIASYLKNISEYDVVLKKENESINFFLKKVKKACDEKIDLLFVNTVQKSMLDLPHYFCFNPKCKMILTIHAANSWFYKKPLLDVKQLVRTVDTILSTITVRFFILPRFNAISVVYSPVKDFILKNTDYQKKVFVFPFSCLDSDLKMFDDKKNSEVVFVVPGQIEKHRRDYDMVLDSFKSLFEKFNDDVTLYILGFPVGVYGNHILERCKELENKGYNIKYFDSFVPEKLYTEIMKSADFIIAPIKINSESFGIIPEIYGVTKGTALVFDGIQYCKPLIVPADFNMVKELKSSTLRYTDSEDLEKVVVEIIHDGKEAERIKHCACENSKHFSIDILREYFINEILSKAEIL